MLSKWLILAQLVPIVQYYYEAWPVNHLASPVRESARFWHQMDQRFTYRMFSSFDLTVHCDVQFYWVNPVSRENITLRLDRFSPRLVRLLHRCRKNVIDTFTCRLQHDYNHTVHRTIQVYQWIPQTLQPYLTEHERTLPWNPKLQLLRWDVEMAQNVSCT